VAHLALPPAETQIPQHGPSFHPPGNPLTGTTTADKLVPILPAADNTGDTDTGSTLDS